jgi:hypothetical protein
VRCCWLRVQWGDWPGWGILTPQRRPERPTSQWVGSVNAAPLSSLFGVAAEACAGGSDRHVPNIRESRQSCASHPLAGDLAVTGGLRREQTGGDAAGPTRVTMSTPFVLSERSEWAKLICFCHPLFVFGELTRIGEAACQVLRKRII